MEKIIELKHQKKKKEILKEEGRRNQKRNKEYEIISKKTISK